jgi:hypothetical protein
LIDEVIPPSVSADTSREVAREAEREEEKPVTKSAIFGIMSYLQSQYAAGQNVTVGVDFKAALSFVYHRQPSCKVVLIDRPVSLTMGRLVGSLSLWDRARLVGSLLSQSAMSLFNKKFITEYLTKALADGTLLTQELTKLNVTFPTVFDILVSERDVYLTTKLGQVVEQLREADRDCTVMCVVGKGHQEYIRRTILMMYGDLDVGAASGLAPGLRAGTSKCDGAALREYVAINYKNSRRKRRASASSSYSEDELKYMCEECIVCELPVKLQPPTSEPPNN